MNDNGIRVQLETLITDVDDIIIRDEDINHDTLIYVLDRLIEIKNNMKRI